MSNDPQVQEILERVPVKFRTPGGAIAVVKEGKLVAQHVWGYANLEGRIPMTAQTVFPICSISKQMVCLVLTELRMKDPDKQFERALHQALREILPHHVAASQDLTVERLVAMQSGLRDYWALTVLWGAVPGARFSIYSDAPKALHRLGDFHFAPGTTMSYSNTNFMAVGLAIEKATGKTIAELLEQRLFRPASMKSARLGADTERFPPPIVGYEGSEDTGYIPYKNRIEWAADAGILASLEDMIAYEKYIDHSSTQDPRSAYVQNAQEPRYIDGNAAYYGHGLIHVTNDGIKSIGHSGALAGFSLHRRYCADKRTSVIVLTNTETDASDVGQRVLAAMFSPTPEKQASSEDQKGPTKASWSRYYLDEETNLAIVTEIVHPNKLSFNMIGHAETLTWDSDVHAASETMEVVVEDRGLVVSRPLENRKFVARKIGAPQLDRTSEASRYTGTYFCEEIQSTFHCTGNGWTLYGAFDGYLGNGPIHPMRYIGENIWLLACHRALDASPPGDWTMNFTTNSHGEIDGAVVGCWLARNIRFVKTG